VAGAGIESPIWGGRPTDEGGFGRLDRRRLALAVQVGKLRLAVVGGPARGAGRAGLGCALGAGAAPVAAATGATAAALGRRRLAVVAVTPAALILRAALVAGVALDALRRWGARAGGGSRGARRLGCGVADGCAGGQIGHSGDPFS
jgi:hypothetical protein